MKKAELFHNGVLKLAKLLHIGIVLNTRVGPYRYRQGYAGTTEKPKGILRKLWNATTEVYIEEGLDKNL